MQSNLDQRIFFYDASATSWTDHTVALNDWKNGKNVSLTFDAGDYLYISTFLPFNHKFFRFFPGSAAARSPRVELLNAPNEWSLVVDQLDYTGGMRNSGVLQWTPNFDKNWGLVTDSQRDIDALAGGPTIYDAYWLRISFTQVTTFTLSYIGQRFSSDNDLFMEYPMLQNQQILAGWAQGKTDWEDQHLLAALYLAKEMRQRNIIFSDNQILDIATLRSPAVHKAAHIIYSGLGARNYAEEIKLAAENFTRAMTQDKFRTDTNANARLDRSEKVIMTTGRASR
jgi:hypothetical protein